MTFIFVFQTISMFFCCAVNISIGQMDLIAREVLKHYEYCSKLGNFDSTSHLANRWEFECWSCEQKVTCTSAINVSDFVQTTLCFFGLRVEISHHQLFPKKAAKVEVAGRIDNWFKTAILCKLKTQHIIKISGWSTVCRTNGIF